jgi:hypothetical protein
MVMNSGAVSRNQQALQFMNAGHYGAGTPQPLSPPPQPPAPKPPGPDAAKPPGPPGQPQPGGQQPKSGTGIQDKAAAMPPGLPGGQPQGAQTQPGLQQPGASKEVFGQELPASQGIGFGGGVLGAAEGAASQAAGMAASMGTFGAGGGAASSATQMLFQLMNRTAAYGAQAAGIGVEGLMETFLPADSPLSNFGNTLPGKLLAGVAGVRPASPNTAGQTKAPLTGEDQGGAQGAGGGGQMQQIGLQMNGPVNVHANNADEFHQDLSRQHMAASAAYPMNTP